MLWRCFRTVLSSLFDLDDTLNHNDDNGHEDDKCRKRSANFRNGTRNSKRRHRRRLYYDSFSSIVFEGSSDCVAVTDLAETVIDLSIGDVEDTLATAHGVKLGAACESADGLVEGYGFCGRG
jgi:hypothetical protein